MAFHMGFSPSPYILSHIFLQLHSTIMYYDTFFSVNPDGTRKLILVNKKEKKWIRRRHNEPYPSKQSNQSKFSKGNIGKIILIYIYIYIPIYASLDEDANPILVIRRNVINCRLNA